MTNAKRGQPRGRFDVLLLDDDGRGYVRVSSSKSKSLTRPEVIRELDRLLNPFRGQDDPIVMAADAERAAIVRYIRSCRENNRAVQVVDVIADRIEQGQHVVPLTEPPADSPRIERSRDNG